MVTRIPVKRSPWILPIMLLFGATSARSCIEIEHDTLRVQLGWYRVVIPRDQIVSVDEGRWPWYGGLGWRTDFRRRLALVGAPSPVVKVSLATPRRGRLLGIPIRFQELYISVDNPHEVKAALAA